MPAADWARRGFFWRDGERLLRFGAESRYEALELLGAERLTPFGLLTTAHRAAVLPEAVAAAEFVVHVASAAVPEAGLAAEAEVLSSGGRRVAALVALGGGRVIDVCKAVAGAHDLPCAAIPTTLSGAELSAVHRPLSDGRGAAPNRPRLVVSDPMLAASQPVAELTASAMNAFGHAMEATYGPGAGPVICAAAIDGARRLVRGLEAAQAALRFATERPPAAAREDFGRLPTASEARAELALGALLAGYAIGASGLGLHHVLCQTVVRETGAPHAMVNAVLAPHVFRFMLTAAPDALAPVAAALFEDGSGVSPADHLQQLAAGCGARRLGELGIGERALAGIAHLAARRPELATTPTHPGEAEALALLRAAL